MNPPRLIVSDPPHPGVALDAAARLIGLDVYKTRLKFIFPAPEVLAASDGVYANKIAESYQDAGVRVTVIDGQELQQIPWPEPVSSFQFTAAGLTARARHGDVELPYDEAVLGVHCKPPSDFRPKPSEKKIGLLSTGLEIAEAIEWTATLDLYFVRGGSLRRLSIVRDVTDFSGLGTRAQHTAVQNMEATVAECSRRFTRMHLDTRLENVRPRRRFVGGDAAFNPDSRERYSFGTLLLRGILSSISPELADLTQYELGSRLGYVTSRPRSSLSVA